MKNILRLSLLTFTLLVNAQQKELSISDATLGAYKGLYPKTLYATKWLDKSDSYIQQTKEGLVITEASSLKILNTITLEDLQAVYPNIKRLPSVMQVNSKTISFSFNSKIEVYDYQNKKKITSLDYAKKAENKHYNKESKNIAYTIDNNLFVATSKSSKIQVTNHTDKNIVAGQAIHRYEFGISEGIFWSPSGDNLAFYQKDETNVSNYPLVDVNAYPAEVNLIKYPMAGQGSEQAKIGLFNTATEKLTYLDIDTTDEHYLTNVSWSPEEKYVFVAEINRAQNHVWFNQYDAKTGKKIKTLFEEQEDTWTEPEHPAVFIPNCKTEFLWMSERDGFMNLYRYNTKGKLLKQVTKFKWVVNDIIGFDAKAKHVFITGTSPDAREEHTYKVNLKNGKYTKLTKTNGTHYGRLSASGKYLLDSYSSISIPRKVDLIATEKATVKSLFTADNPLKDYNLGKTEFVNLKAQDGTLLHAKVSKPANFDANKKYPVLIYLYGGPHAQLVTNSWLAGSSLWMPAFATSENYIVFTVDNRGSKNRGFKFENTIHRRLGEVEMKDQLTGVEYLKSLPYVDANRIAVDGWSFGGFLTTSLMLRHPEVFTTAVAGGPVTDWKYYEVMYGERYMDTPEENPEGYKKAKLHNYISQLKGKLLLIHGSVDPTVVPQHSMTLLQEAVKQEVQLDFFTYPMHKHNVRGMDRAHLIIKLLDYIVANNK